MNKAKIQLSESELRLATDSEVILTKNLIIHKVYEMFGVLADELREVTKTHPAGLPEETTRLTPKIARGENYLGLPYVMLDYPRIFEKQNILAVRMMFWWGNFFSTTLHLSGKYKKKYESRLADRFSFFSSQQFYVCVSDEEWHHHFGKENYQEIHTLTREEFKVKLREKDFLKLSAKIPLTASKNAADFFLESFKQMLLISG